MDPATFFGTRHKEIRPVVPTNADDSDHGLDYDDDVADPDFNPTTVSKNGFVSGESDDMGEDDLSIYAHEEGSASNQQNKPCTKKRRICTGNPVEVHPRIDLLNEPLSRERQWRKRDIDNLYPPETDYAKPDHLQTPYQYFSQFFTPEMISHIAQNTNLYSVQVLTKSIDTDDNEIQKFLAMLLFMGICHLPAVDDYWSVQLRYDLIADVMSVNRFKCLKRYIHFTDNNNEQNDEDKFWKVRPLSEMFRGQCRRVESSRFQSVD